MNKITLTFIFLLAGLSSSFAQFSENFDADGSLPVERNEVNRGDDNTGSVSIHGIGATHCSTIDAEAAAVPGCVTNISPIDGATDVSNGLVTFAWAEGFGEVAASYDFYYGLTAGEANILIGNFTSTSVGLNLEEEYQGSSQTGFETFYWKVIAKNSAGEALGCSEWSFTTQYEYYCLNGNLYPEETFVPTTCNGLVANIIAEDCYAGQYSNVDVVLGQTYTFNSGEPDDFGSDFITISNELGDTPLISSGTPVTWVSDRDGVIRFYSHLSDGDCTTEAVDRVRSVICGVATCIPSVAFSKVSNCPIESFYATATITDLGSATSITVTDGSTSQTLFAPGLVSFGPYTNGSYIVLTVTNDQDSFCTILYEFIQETCSSPMNDNITNAEVISCNNFYSGDTTTATLDQANDTLYFGVDLDAPNVWYAYTGSGLEEMVTLDLCGSSYNTSVLVLTGSPGSLTAIAGNDDYTCGSASSLNSKISFASDGTTTYYIVVEGYDSNDVGDYNLFVTCSPPALDNQSCISALEINVNSADLDSFFDNSFSDESGVQPVCDPFGSAHDVWFSFVAPASGSVDIFVLAGGALTGVSASSVNFSTYSGACDALFSLDCVTSQSHSAIQYLTGLNAGEVYYIQVWNNPGEQGTFLIRLTDYVGLATNDFESSNFKVYPNPVTGLLNLSSNTNITNITVFNLLGQEMLSNSVNSKLTQIDMSLLSKGTYMVKVTADNQVKTIKVIKE